MFLVPFGVVVYMLGGYLTSEVLGLLGKDVTLAARTEIWSVVLESMRGHYLLGGGYGSGWELVRDQITQRFGRSIGHAHNGHLQLMVHIGIVGVVLTQTLDPASFASYGWRIAFGMQSEFACFWVTYAVLYLAGNVAASFALDYNSLDLVLFVMTPNLLRRRALAARASWENYASQAGPLDPGRVEPAAR